jgi:uncharacterized membrane protein YhaH (DUF805 family)
MELLFSSTGRMGRRAFIALTALLLLLTLAFQALPGGAVHDWARWIVYPALLFSGACLLCKRLHDRGRRGWWAGLVLWALAMAWPSPHDAGQIPYLLILLGATVELGIMPGQKGPNRFGPSLLKTA